MARFNCFCVPLKKKTEKEKLVYEDGKNFQKLLEKVEKSSETGDQRSSSFSLKTTILGLSGSARYKAKVMNHESPDSQFHAVEVNPLKNQDSDTDTGTTFHSADKEAYQKNNDLDEGDESEKIEFLASCILKRSCSDLTTRRMKSDPTVQMTPNSVSCREIRTPMENQWKKSPVSVRSHCCDEKLIKKHCSASILPSKSRSLWWKLLIWSNNISYKPKKSLPVNEISINNFIVNDNSKAASLTAISSLTRVNEWVKESCALPQDEILDVEEGGCEIISQSSLARESPRSPGLNTPEEILHANSFIQSLTFSSSIAHVAGVGLRAIPSMSHFSSLRAVNLSGNFIVNIPSGSLPKSLHVLDLSKNKIQTIQGLRELTRLRNLDLSHNRISRIGQGLSSCTMIKELYLSNNKISIVEGLHRLLKLTVLDISNNKITAAKALGQLVANYNSLMALDLSGNPIQTNISNDHLRKIVRGVLPKLALLNKHPIDPLKAREINEDAKAKGVHGNGIWNSKRTKSGKMLVQSQWSSTSRIVRGSSKHSDKKITRRSKADLS